MSHAVSPLRLRLSLALVLLPLSCGLAVGQQSVAPPPGLRHNTPQVHALVGARIVVSPGETIEQGAIVLRNGVITAVGAEVATPPDARVWDLKGKSIYAGLIDAYGELPSGVKAATVAASYWNDKVTPQVRAADLVSLDRDVNRKLRSQGIAVRLVAPGQNIIKGTSALVTTGDDNPAQSLVAEQVALHLRLTPIRTADRDYPTSAMGALTLVRQAMHDAQWYRDAWAAYHKQTGLERPEQSEALDALQPYPNSERPIIVDTSNELYLLRADQLGREFELNVIVRGSGREYRRLDAVRQTGRAVIVPLDFPETPNVKTPEAALNASLEALMHWDLAPENPARLADAGVRIAFTTQGLKDSGKFIAAVRRAVERGLSRDDALRALTITPAELFGVSQRLGTLEPGKAAHLTVVDGDLFDKQGKIIETWVDGQRYEVVRAPLADVRGQWELEFLDADKQPQTARLKLAGEPAKLTGELRRDEAEGKLLSVTLNDAQLGGSFKGEPFGWDGVVRLSATVSLEPKSEHRWLGSIVWADGSQSPLTARRMEQDNSDTSDKPNEATKDDEKDNNNQANNDDAKSDGRPDADEDKGKSDQQDAKDKAASETENADQPAKRKPLFAVNYPLGDLGRSTPLPPQPESVLFKNATLWTCGPDGKLERASLLVKQGKIAAIGNDLEAPADALVIDCQGKQITPGILDCHSHVATDGGVNESGQTISAEVRIGDFVNPNDPNIYRQLAGGVTTIHVMHGSANTIGGQTQVIKLRFGALPEEMKFATAAPGIKFALGENVKQSNAGERFVTRYPQTRMGVEQLVLDAFRAAQHYQRTWNAWRQEPKGIPPRVDLELEALVEILEGKRFIHCHSYRQDEILAFLRTCAAFHIKVGTLQHVLEGYKLADVMAEQNVGGSTFSDWWAYKFEVYDAIPYNGALMHNAGVLVSFNSDYPELARRLNLEAAKAVKYGDVPEQEALKFVTLNPARQLKIDAQVGSLEVGKDADLVIWNGSPLSTYSRCEQTWIDGRKYFDRDEDYQRRQTADQMRAQLIQRALAGSGETDKKDADKKDSASR
jgi:N-acetylglucosamine-6-phosphate deacetylase